MEKAMKLFENRSKEAFRVFFYSFIFTVFISCESVSGVAFGISDKSDAAKSKEYYEGLLEQFCQTYYDDLYRDFWGTRQYVQGSLVVDSIRPCGVREVMVYGKHDFTGRIGNLYEGYDFKANIYESKKGSNDYIVTFEKESKKIISGKFYTESRTKTFHYEK